MHTVASRARARSGRHACDTYIYNTAVLLVYTHAFIPARRAARASRVVARGTVVQLRLQRTQQYLRWQCLMDGKAMQRWAGVMGATGVGMGAFGAHALKVRPICIAILGSERRTGRGNKLPS